MKRILPAVLLALGLVLTACGGSGNDGPGTAVSSPDKGGMVGGMTLDLPYEPPTSPKDVVDTDEQPFDFSTSLDRDVNLVFFGYTKCPDVCQIVMGTIASALNRLDAGEQARVGVVFVTTDPARDTPEVLRTYLDRFNPDFTGVHASLPSIIELGKSYAVHVEKGEKLPSGGYEVVHSDPVIALDDAGRGTVVWTNDVRPATWPRTSRSC